MRLILWLALSLSLALGCVLSAGRISTARFLQQPATPAPAAGPSVETTPSTPASSKVWVGHYAEYEDFLRTAVIDRLSNPSIGVTGGTKHAYFKPGGLVAGGALRDLSPGRYGGFFESYKSEIAAYRLDRLLELDMVPPTVEVRYNGKMASLQLWVQNTRTLKENDEKKLRAPDAGQWNYQRNRMYMFDDLVGNIDENQGNLLLDPQWNFIKIDCSRCFTNTLEQPFEIGKKLTRIDRPFFDRVKALDKATVKREIGEFVEGGTIDALFARRDVIVKVFDKLVRAKGESQVILP